MANAASGRGSGSRTPGSGARASRRVTGTGAARPGAGPGSRRNVPRQRTTAGAARAASGRPRFTGRAAVLVLVLALLMVSYASSMRAYLQQRSHLAQLSASIARSQSDVDRLSREAERWRDPAYVQTMAHQRFGWVLPGEIGFQVLEPDGKPMSSSDALPATDSVEKANQPQWWQSTWGSVVSAGTRSPDTKTTTTPKPARTIRRLGPGGAAGSGG